MVALCVPAKGTERNAGLNPTAIHHGWALQLGGMAGYGTFRDMGTAPLSFYGVQVQGTLGLHLLFHSLCEDAKGYHGNQSPCARSYRMAFSVVSHTAFGIMEDAVKPNFNFNAFDIHNTLRFKFLKAFKTDNPTLYWGVAMTNFLDVTVNPSYENSAAGVSNFLGPEIIGRINVETKWAAPIMFHGEVDLMALSAILRPGYSYIDNYSSSQPVLDALFSDFEVNIKPFAAISTDIGMDIVTGPASRISFSYIWSFHTTGGSGQHRFDHATHLLSIDFLIKLRTK